MTQMLEEMMKEEMMRMREKDRQVTDQLRDQLQRQIESQRNMERVMDYNITKLTTENRRLKKKMEEQESNVVFKDEAETPCPDDNWTFPTETTSGDVEMCPSR